MGVVPDEQCLSECDKGLGRNCSGFAFHDMWESLPLDLERGKPLISLLGVREKLLDVVLFVLCGAMEDGIHQVGSSGRRVSAGVWGWQKLLSIVLSAVVWKSLVLSLDPETLRIVLITMVLCGVVLVGT